MPAAHLDAAQLAAASLAVTADARAAVLFTRCPLHPEAGTGPEAWCYPPPLRGLCGARIEAAVRARVH